MYRIAALCLFLVAFSLHGWSQAPVSTLEIELEVEVCGSYISASVTPDDLDDYDWSHDPCDGSPTCLYNATTWGPATVWLSVTAYSGECSAADFDVVEVIGDDFICFPGNFPDVLLCPNECVEVCGADIYPDAVSYEWQDFLAPGFSLAELCDANADSSCVVLGPGTYRLVATNECGTQGWSIFTVDGWGDLFLGDGETVSYQDELTPHSFQGGLQNSGNLTLYLATDDSSGWGDAYLNVEIVTVFGDVMNYNGIQMGAGMFFQTESFSISAGDAISIEYICGTSENDDLNSVWIFNAMSGNAYTIAGALSNNIDGSPPDQVLECGTIYESSAFLDFGSLAGSWSIASSEFTGTFSVEDFFNTTFTPDDIGLYELIFTHTECDYDYHFWLDYTETPGFGFEGGDDDITDPVEYAAGFEGSSDSGPGEPPMIIYPNPSQSGQEVSFSKSDVISWTIFDTSGITVKQGSGYEIVSPAEPGIYQVLWQSESEQGRTSLMVLQD